MKKRSILLFMNLAFAWVCVTAQQQQPPKPPSVEERLKHVSEKIDKEIKLTAAQKEKIAAAYKDFFAEMEKLRSKDGKHTEPPPPPPPPVNKEEADKLVKARDAKIKTVLNADQYAKYVEVEKTLRPPRPGGPMPPAKDGKNE